MPQEGSIFKPTISGDIVNALGRAALPMGQVFQQAMMEKLKREQEGKAALRDAILRAYSSGEQVSPEGLSQAGLPGQLPQITKTPTPRQVIPKGEGETAIAVIEAMIPGLKVPRSETGYDPAIIQSLTSVAGIYKSQQAEQERTRRALAVAEIGAKARTDAASLRSSKVKSPEELTLKINDLVRKFRADYVKEKFGTIRGQMTDEQSMEVELLTRQYENELYLEMQQARPGYGAAGSPDVKFVTSPNELIGGQASPSGMPPIAGAPPPTSTPQGLPKGVPAGSVLLPAKSKSGFPVYRDPQGGLWEVPQ